MAESILIEALYWQLRRRGGQRAQLETGFSTDSVAAAFAATVADVRSLRADGPFFPDGTRKSLHTLAQERVDWPDIADTEHVQALLWQPTRWHVAEHPSLDFEYLAREVTPTSSVAGGRRVWLTDEHDRRLSLDALLVNAEDRTPIVAEIKVGGDENAELALIQALAAAAQLSSSSQMRRLHRQFRESLGETQPTRLDLYVIMVRAPDRGVRPLLAQRAHERVNELVATGALAQWVRRMVFLDLELVGGPAAFSVATVPRTHRG